MKDAVGNVPRNPPHAGAARTILAKTGSDLLGKTALAAS
jgi:hypothetical protein